MAGNAWKGSKRSLSRQKSTKALFSVKKNKGLPTWFRGENKSTGAKASLLRQNSDEIVHLINPEKKRLHYN